MNTAEVMTTVSTMLELDQNSLSSMNTCLDFYGLVFLFAMIVGMAAVIGAIEKSRAEEAEFARRIR